MNNFVSNKNIKRQNLFTNKYDSFLLYQKYEYIWVWIKRIFLVLFIFFVVFQFLNKNNNNNVEHVGLIDIDGPIFNSYYANSENFSRSMNLAYKSKGLKAIILRINSPGGSPVQADYIYNTVQYYRKNFPKIKIYSVCSDICTSAAYYIASGAEYIYANPSSIIGSIGVLYNGFGFVDTIKKLGISRRVYTSGENKNFLDSFLPIKSYQLKVLHRILFDIHKQFIKQVIKGRGNRLKINKYKNIFSGIFWTGIDAKTIGLIDGFASSDQVAFDILKINKVINYSYKYNIIEKFFKTMIMSVMSQFSMIFKFDNEIRY
ncbi:S49 family peptidase [Candidatus Legionella polyplacis]|uniref:S49 family peptidase n=1 Tax=Candidatus Legionella polyplacis TaxID=2005262 RepID=A0ABZ2GWX8_9GAMM